MSDRLTNIRNVRRRREELYRSRLRRAAIASILIHISLFIGLVPLKHRIPLARTIGYEGALRILPEISVARPPGTTESELALGAGLGSRPFMRVVDIKMVSKEVALESEARADRGIRHEALGDALLTELEQVLPQPQSRDVVVDLLVKPAYPASSVLAGVEGVVVFRVYVTKEGTVERVWLMNSEVDRACEESARRALLRWRFRPHIVGGVPTEFLVDQRIRFRLTDAAGASSLPER
jgi:TonB family protein